MHVLVTGGAGFIGSHIVEYHLNNNDIVHVIDDLSTGCRSNIDYFNSHPNLHFTDADLLLYPDIEKIVDWADRIYHMAAVVGIFRVLEEPERVLSVNIGATERLFRAARKSIWKPRIIFASTSEVYGNDSRQALDESADYIIPNNLKSRVSYAVSKLAAESFANTYAQRFNIPITILRFFNTTGPRQSGKYGMVVPRFVKMAVENKPITVYGNGEQVRSFIDVRDMVRLIVDIADNSDTVGKTINVGHDQPISINELANMVKELSNSDSDIIHIPYSQAYNEDFDDCMYRKPNLGLLRHITTYQPQWDLKKTLTDLIKAEEK